MLIVGLLIILLAPRLKAFFKVNDKLLFLQKFYKSLKVSMETVVPQ